MLSVILKPNKLLERFTKKNCKKQNQKEFRVKKVIKRMLNGKVMITVLTVCVIKKT